MRYLGGKARIARELSTVVREHVGPVWEPFCGALNMSAQLLPWLCSDASVPLMSMIQAVASGWMPPQNVDEELFRFAKTLPETNPLHGFCRIGCSFGGDPNAGFARCARGDNFAAQSARAIVRDVAKLVAAGTTFECLSFFDVEPHETECAIYCDPPYRGTNGYGAPFDHGAFYTRCLEWAASGVPVLVSEYECPIGRVVWEKSRVAGLRGAEARHTERLYLVTP